jgi:dCTP deaminase
MFLNSSEIGALVASGVISIRPFGAHHLRPASHVLHLSNRFRSWKQSDTPIDIYSPDVDESQLSEIEENDSITIAPGEFVLSSTFEKVGLSDDYAGDIANLSHLARMGVSVFLGASWISPGFGITTPTEITLEIVNHNPSPVTLRSHMPVCHLRVIRINHSDDSPPSRHVYEGRDPLAAPLFYDELHDTAE